jgi:hypothetical protein
MFILKAMNCLTGWKMNYLNIIVAIQSLWVYQSVWQIMSLSEILMVK